MTDVCFICVREDVSRAELLAALFDAAGFSVSGAPDGGESFEAFGATVIVASQASARTPCFNAVAQRAMDASSAVVACFGPVATDAFNRAPMFDLSAWSGEGDQPVIESLLAHVAAMQKATVSDAAPVAAPSFPIVDEVCDLSVAASEADYVAQHMEEAWPGDLSRVRRVAFADAPQRAPTDLNADWPIRKRKPFPKIQAFAAAALVATVLLGAAVQISLPHDAPLPPRQANAVAFDTASIGAPVDMDAITAPPEEAPRFGLASAALPPSDLPVRRVAYRLRADRISAPAPSMSRVEAKSGEAETTHTLLDAEARHKPKPEENA